MIPSLPIEITRHIIQLSLPLVLQTTYQERYDILLAYSLVNSLWRSIAQDELIKHLYVLDHTQPQRTGKLLKELERRTAAGLNPRVLSLRIHAGVNTPLYGMPKDSYPISADIPRLFSTCCKDAEKIWLKGSNLLTLLDILDTNSYTKLKALDLEASDYILVEIPESNFDLRFPALTHLVLSVAGIDAFNLLCDVLLQPLVVPCLISLGLIDFKSANFSPRPLIPSSIAGQLKRLAISASSRNEDDIDVSSMKALDALVIGDVSNLQSQFLNIPATLSTIQICESTTSCYAADLENLPVWITSVDSQHQLRHISFPLPIEDDIGWKPRARQIRELQKELLHFLDGRGIALKYTENLWINSLEISANRIHKKYMGDSD